MIKWNNFRSIYRFFLVKIVVGWSKNLCNLIIAVGFNFFANLTVRSSLNCWDQTITVGSSHDFKSDCLDISPIHRRYMSYISQYIFDILSKIKLTRACATNPIFPLYIDPKPIYKRYIADIIDFFAYFSLKRLSIANIVSNIIDIRYIGRYIGYFYP